MSKYIFGHNSTQSPPNFSFMVFSKLQNLTSIFNKNIKQLSCVSILNLMVLCKLYFTDLIKDFRKLSTLLIGSFSIELFFFLIQMSALFRNLSNHWICREQNKNFQTILVIIFWNFPVLVQVHILTLGEQRNKQISKTNTNIYQALRNFIRGGVITNIGST